MMNLLKLGYCFAAGALALAFYSARLHRERRASQREPPTVPPLIPVPFIGHILGILWYRVQYYTAISKNHTLPIVKFSLFGNNIYVVRSPELMPVLHRLPRVVSLWFVEAKFTAKMGAMSESTAKKMEAHLGPESEGQNTFTIEGLKVMHQVLGPKGGGLAEMDLVSAQVFKARLDDLITSNQSVSVDLWAWIQHEITFAMTEAVYGPGNPYRDPKVESGFWDFEGDVAKIMLTGVLPRFIARRGIAGRETVVAAMRAYFETGDCKQGSILTRARWGTMDGVITIDDAARLETVNGIALLSNTVPTAFWTVHYIFSDPILLDDIRTQIMSITTTEGDTRTINLGLLKNIPLIFSVIYESLRLRATGIGPRMIMEDMTVGDNQYKLKKGSMLLIANRVLHFHKGTWGEASHEFDPNRFTQKSPGSAFRGFGGGVNLCPGKSLAMVQVATLVAMLTMRFDLDRSGGIWVEPEQDLTKVLQIAPPRSKVMVKFVPRKDAVAFSWNFEV